MRFTRERYQSGCLVREPRKAGPAVWIFRWRETRPEGRVNRKVVVGTITQYPTKAAALKAVEALRVNVNTGTYTPITIHQLATHYTQIELSTKAFSTSQVYGVYLKTWVLPQWGHIRPSDVRTVAVEQWLHSLPLADGSKAKVRNIMSVLFSHAIRYEWLSHNPITHVRQSAKRQRIPEILEAVEMRNLMAELGQPFSTMVFLAAIGLRASEFLALKWKDANLATGEILLRRGVVQQVVGEMKTETSQKPLPMAGALAKTLQDWKTQSSYNNPEDWIFASPVMRGSQPYWPGSLLVKRIRPAAYRVGITKHIGWHTFRRTFATLLTGSGEDIKTTQELMRHANSRITLDLYAQAVTSTKRSAQGKVVELFQPKGTVPFCSHGKEPELT